MTSFDLQLAVDRYPVLLGGLRVEVDRCLSCPVTSADLELGLDRYPGLPRGLRFNVLPLLFYGKQGFSLEPGELGIVSSATLELSL